jgi:hypothetical protein
LVVNRHPAIVEYIGEDYPLFYDSYDEIDGLIGRAAEGNEYMKAMDLSWMDGAYFADRVVEAIGVYCDY